MIKALTDLFCINRKFLVFNFVRRNIKLKYRQSYLGILWTLLVPAASILVYYVVFQHVMRVNIPNYLVFLVSGILPWSFFNLALSTGMESIVANYSLANKVPMPLQVFSFTETITAFINFLFAIPVFILLLMFSAAPLSGALFVVPVLLGLLFIQSYSLALILSIGFVYFRDLRHIMSVVFQTWFYATPILYSVEMIPEKYRWILWLNPVGFIFEGIHSATALAVALPANKIIGSAVWTLALLISAIVVLNVRRRDLVENM